MIKVDGNNTGTYDGILYIMSGDKAWYRCGETEGFA